MFGALYGASTPLICCTFSGSSSHGAIVPSNVMVCGMCCDGGAHGYIEEAGWTNGFVNMHDGIISNNESSIMARYAMLCGMSR